MNANKCMVKSALIKRFQHKVLAWFLLKYVGGDVSQMNILVKFKTTKNKS
ncbi:hypothetical protein GCM10007063_16410 [Lentibacillus kapialis]|uniref:Uncharacterized protein n=1 Tax=Lentibacillus kapialis TaxID=340214 RepID=A0A917PW15_9BACI|nr:hypothetical protein GCM10007063_16410 [Lentibacillus kapialis]